jgi:hypothetical protein
MQLHLGNICATVGRFCAATWPWNSGDRMATFRSVPTGPSHRRLLASPTSGDCTTPRGGHEKAKWPTHSTMVAGIAKLSTLRAVMAFARFFHRTKSMLCFIEQTNDKKSTALWSDSSDVAVLDNRRFPSTPLNTAIVAWQPLYAKIGNLLPSRDRERYLLIRWPWFSLLFDLIMEIRRLREMLTKNRFDFLISQWCFNISESCPSAAHERSKMIFVGNTVGLSCYCELVAGQNVVRGGDGQKMLSKGISWCHRVPKRVVCLFSWPTGGSTDAAGIRRCRFNTRPVPSSQP